MGRNAIVGQSGGPTAVINSSLVGVFQAAKSRGAQHVYGMRYGVKGLLEEQVVDLSDTLRDNLDIESSSARPPHTWARAGTNCPSRQRTRLCMKSCLVF